MNEKFNHIRSAEEEYQLEPEEFEVRYARFVSDPIAFLVQLRVNYLDEEGDRAQVVEAAVNEIAGHLEYAVEHDPHVAKHEILEPFITAYESEDDINNSRYLFQLLKEADFEYGEIEAYLRQIPSGLTPNVEMQYRNDLAILNEIYGVK